jgi:glycine hydroxymethyltransferase
LHEGIGIAMAMQDKSGPKLKDFIAEFANTPELEALKVKVHGFATKFPMPGFDPKTMKYQDPAGPPGHA